MISTLAQLFRAGMPVCGWIGTIKEDSSVAHEATMMNICSKDGSTELFPRTIDSFDQIG